MRESPDRLYELLPAVYRLRDAEQGYPLQALLRVIAEQVNVVENDIARLYENWFIETCEEWVVPYIGDLIGYHQVNEGVEAGDPNTLQARQRSRIVTPRRDVAATIGNRRRKGTLALLESLASEAAGWPARAVEFYKLLGWTQHVSYTRPLLGRTADLRHGDALDLIDTPFDSSAHTIDVRRPLSIHDEGYFNLPSVGVFVWRLKTYSVTHAPAHGLDEIGPHAYTFSALGHDAPLYNYARPETEPTHIAEELNLPVPIRRRAFAEQVVIEGKATTRASADYYGKGEQNLGKSLVIWAPDWPKKGAGQPIAREAVIPADLKGWRYRAPADHVLVDPQRGRIIFPPGQLPKKGVRVSYHYGFSADIGGGEYDRQLTQPNPLTLYRVSKTNKSGEEIFETIRAALDKWTADKKEAKADQERLTKLQNAVIEIGDSEVYTEQQSLQITLAQNESLQLRAANRARPIIRMLDYTEGMDALNVSGKSGSRFTLDGLIITGRGIQISKCDNGAVIEQDESPTEVTDAGDLCAVTIRHCTLVPGWELHPDCKPKQTEPSLLISYVQPHIRIEHSILGGFVSKPMK
jgi:hypothetical protein